MIKINLLESITDRPTGAAMVEARVTTPARPDPYAGPHGLRSFDGRHRLRLRQRQFSITARQKLNWKSRRRINQEMLAVNKEQAELEKKAQAIQGRIDAIKKLRESQQGPSAVLRDIKARFDSVPGLYLKSLGTEGRRTHDQGHLSQRSFRHSIWPESRVLVRTFHKPQHRNSARSWRSAEKGAPTPADSVVVLQQPEVVSFHGEVQLRGRKAGASSERQWWNCAVALCGYQACHQRCQIDRQITPSKLGKELNQMKIGNLQITALVRATRNVRRRGRAHVRWVLVLRHQANSR